MSSNGYRRNDRVKYSQQGVSPSLRGLTGTVKDFTRAGWVIVDFDNGFVNVPVTAINLDHCKTTQKGKAHAET